MWRSAKKAIKNGLALLGLWGSTYLEFLADLSLEMAETAEELKLPILMLGVAGMGGAFWSARKLSRDPRWRAKHGLLARPSGLAPRRG
jgi:hypothetical protein